MSLMLWMLAIFVIAIAVTLTKKIMLGHFVTNSPTFLIFFQKIRAASYSLIAVTFLCWLIFRESAEYMMIFSTVLMFDLARINYELLEDSYDEIREIVLNE
jgi:hypothetical protein